MCVCVHALRAFKIYSVSNSIVTCSHPAVCYIPRTYSFYNWKFVVFDQHLLIFSHPVAAGNHHSTVSEFNFLRFHVDVIYSICLSLISFTYQCPQDPSTLSQMAEFLLSLDWTPFHWIYIHHGFFMHYSINGHFGCFYPLALVNGISLRSHYHLFQM